MTDRQKILKRVEEQSKLMLDYKQSLHALMEHSKVILVSMLGHLGILGKEKADRLAEKEVEKFLAGPGHTFGHSRIFIERPSKRTQMQLLNLSRK